MDASCIGRHELVKSKSSMLGPDIVTPTLTCHVHLSTDELWYHRIAHGSGIHRLFTHYGCHLSTSQRSHMPSSQRAISPAILLVLKWACIPVILDIGLVKSHPCPVHQIPCVEHVPIAQYEAAGENKLHPRERGGLASSNLWHRSIIDLSREL